MTFKLFLKRYWRIPLVALLAALLAFAASFAIKPTYTSKTRLLIVEGSTTSLNSSGVPISNQTGSIVDSGLAQTLAETQAGLASSREVAIMVVDKLHLDAPKPPQHGVIHSLEGAAASTYAHLKAWVTAGFYKTAPRREKAIQTTESAITGSDLAPAGGSTNTGQPDSFILELDATGETAVKAAAIANAAADALVIVSQQRFQHDSQFYAKALATQLGDANAALASANQAVSNYELAHNISSLDQQLVQNVQDSGSLSSELVTTQATVQGDKQTVASLQATLAATPPTENSDQSISTGRSTTADNTTQANPVYQTVAGQLSQAQATLAADSAKVASLQGQNQADSSSALTQAQAGLLDLEQQVTADQNSVQTLSTSVQQADANVQISPVELSRLGGADLPTYPTSPKRYLYLLIGLLLGALGGCWLTYLARRRLQPVEPELEEESLMARTAELDMRAASRPAQQPVSVGVHAAHAAGNGENGSGENGSGENGSGENGTANGTAHGTAMDNGDNDDNGEDAGSNGSGAPAKVLPGQGGEGPHPPQVPREIRTS